MVTDSKNKGFADRLNEKLNEAGAPDWDSGRQVWVASYFKSDFKISPIGVRKWMIGEGMPDTKKLHLIAAKLHTSVNYLLSGDDKGVKESAPKYRSDREDIHKLIDSLPPRLLNKARAALKLFVVEDSAPATPRAKKRA